MILLYQFLKVAIPGMLPPSPRVAQLAIIIIEALWIVKFLRAIRIFMAINQLNLRVFRQLSLKINFRLIAQKYCLIKQRSHYVIRKKCHFFP